MIITRNGRHRVLAPFPSPDPWAPSPPSRLSYLIPPIWARGEPLTQGKANQRPGWVDWILSESVCLPFSLWLPFLSSLDSGRGDPEHAEKSGLNLFNVLVRIPGYREENGALGQRWEQRRRPLLEEGAPDHSSCPLQTLLGSPPPFNRVSRPAVNPGLSALTSQGLPLGFHKVIPL